MLLTWCRIYMKLKLKPQSWNVLTWGNYIVKISFDLILTLFWPDLQMVKIVSTSCIFGTLQWLTTLISNKVLLSMEVLMIFQGSLHILHLGWYFNLFFLYHFLISVNNSALMLPNGKRQLFGHNAFSIEVIDKFEFIFRKLLKYESDSEPQFLVSGIQTRICVVF